MRRATNHGDLLVELEPICEAFEEALRGGESVRVESFVSSAVGAERHVLLRELIALEIYYDRRRGATTSIDSYRARFPGDHEAVTGAWTTAGGEDPAPKLAPGVSFGNYAIESEIGRGGMGVVYRATHSALDRVVALKVLPASGPEQAQLEERFEREARAIARLHHGNIVPVFEAGSENGSHYFAMQLIEGSPLDELIHQRTKLAGAAGDEGEAAPRALARQMAQVADALHYAHERGVVHRDIKPSNILIDDHGVAWVVDFGVARIEGSNLTGQGDLLGTIRYMPPERFSGIGDARGDIYSLGVTLFEAIAGRPAFEEASPTELMGAITGRDVPRLRSLVPGLSKDLETIVAKAAAQAPSERYASAAELAVDLLSYAERRPIVARRPPLHERAGRWVRRHPVHALAFGLLVLTTCGSVAVTLGFKSKNSRITALSGRVGGLLAESEAARRDLRATLYRSDMLRGGQEAFAIGGASKLTKMLPAWSEEPEEVDQRGWEWYFLRSLIGGDDGGLWDDSFTTNTVDVDALGQRLATAGGTGARIWDLQTREPIFDLDPGAHCGRVRFSPDGSRLATNAWGTVKVYDAATGELLAETSNVTQNYFSWHPDGKRVLLTDSSLKFWDYGSGELTPAAVSESGSLIADTNHTGDRILLQPAETQQSTVDARTGQVISRFRAGRFTGAGEFAPEDNRVVTADRSNAIHVWDGDTGKGLLKIEDAHADVINETRWSADNRFILSSSADTTVKVWDASDGSLVRVYLGHSGDVLSAAFNGSSTGLVSSARGGDLRFWDLRGAAGNRQFRPFGPVGEVREPELIWHPVRGVLSVACDGRLAYFSGESGPSNWDYPEGVAEPHWSPDGRYVQSINDDVPTLVDSKTGQSLFTEELLSSLSIPKHHSWTQTWRWSACSKRLYAKGEGGFFVIEGFPDLITIRKQPCEVDPLHLEMSPDGASFAIPNWRGIDIVDTATGRVTATIPEHHFDVHGHDFPVAYYSPDGERLAVSHGTRLLIFRSDSLACTTVHQEHARRIGHVSWSPDGERLATCGWDNTVRILDPNAGATLTLVCPAPPLFGAWSPDGATLAAMDRKGVVHLWDATFAMEGEKAGTLLPLNPRGAASASVGAR